MSLLAQPPMDEAEDELLVDNGAPRRTDTRAWILRTAAFAVLLLLVGSLGSLVYQRPLTIRGLSKAVGLAGDDGSFDCGEMRCTAGSICCGGNKCCMAGSSCCGGTCLAAGGICCRNRTDAPLLCTPGTDCCGKGTDTAQCCTTGCADGPFVACKL
ncbi:unnamed protein product [Symbiodinium natans]|uniref:Uncharacterized protein n=1 Tax=Symbiodinium natans TaxID=878477 RepID=A0A812KJ61_9DINO|nr:unnamed protein product [Symbiodinium natans]